MEIGKPKRKYVIEPARDPVPRPVRERPEPEPKRSPAREPVPRP